MLEDVLSGSTKLTLRNALERHVFAPYRTRLSYGNDLFQSSRQVAADEGKNGNESGIYPQVAHRLLYDFKRLSGSQSRENNDALYRQQLHQRSAPRFSLSSG